MPKKKGIDNFDVRTVVAQLAENQLSPKLLSREQRVECVEYMRYALRLNQATIAKTLKCDGSTVNGDLEKVHERLGQYLQTGSVALQALGEIYQKLQTNYQIALEKKDVAGANKATELLQKLYQDMELLKKSEEEVHHTVSILDLASHAVAQKEAKAQE